MFEFMVEAKQNKKKKNIHLCREREGGFGNFVRVISYDNILKINPTTQYTPINS